MNKTIQTTFNATRSNCEINYFPKTIKTTNLC